MNSGVAWALVFHILGFVFWMGGLLVTTQVPAMDMVESSPDHRARASPPLRVLGVTLGRNTLDDVVARFGQSQIKRCTREEEAPKELCYVSAGSDRTKVVFQSGFSGGWTELDGYKIISGDLIRDCYRHCPRSAAVNANLRAGRDLRLGLTPREVTDILGKPNGTKTNEFTFEWHSRQPMTREETEKERQTLRKPVKEPYWDIQDAADVVFLNSKVVELDVQHTVTY